MFDQVRQLAVTDPLTGLSNYRTLINVMEAETQRSRRTGRPFAILLLDLDGLKAINDEHGASGRQPLHLPPGNPCFVSHSRAMDTAALTYGGDEFAVVLPEAGRGSGCLGKPAHFVANAWRRTGNFPMSR